MKIRGFCQRLAIMAIVVSVVQSVASPLVPRGENIALGKSYTLSPAPNYSDCTDPDDSKQLTDGVYTSGRLWLQKGAVGWRGGNPVIITLDLGQPEPIRGVAFNTAGGAAEVAWPEDIYVLVGDDGKTFREAGELTGLDVAHDWLPAPGYATHRFWTDALRVHGRYVMFVVLGGNYTFADEIEVYRGEPAWLAAPLTGGVVTNGAAYAWTRRLGQSVVRRLRLDAWSVRQLATNGTVSVGVQKQVGEALAAVKAGIPALPASYDDNFRAVLPLNALHQRIFQAQALIWRAGGAAPLTAWPSDLWNPLALVHAAPKGQAVVNVAMMQNEFRAGAFNLSNASDTNATLALNLSGLPGGDNPAWVTVHEVQWTDTKSGVPIATALPEAERGRDGYVIHVPAGFTRQVWLTFHSAGVAPGRHQGHITISGGQHPLEVPLNVRVYPLRFPDRPRLHLGGWDYTDSDGYRDITPRNRDQVIACLKEHWVDSPWATAAVLPGGTFQADDTFASEPNPARFDAWLKRWPDSVRYCVFVNVTRDFLGVAPGAPGFQPRVGTWIKYWARHAQQRGLKPEQLALLLADEPQRPEQDALILAWASAIHAAGTGVKTWEDPVHANPFAASQEMLAACDVLCPNRPNFLANTNYHAYFAGHRPPASELAFYSCSGPMDLMDPYSYVRLQAWECWQQGARTSYFWAFSDACGGSGWNQYIAKRPNYAPYLLNETSVTTAKQMEAMRESVEDYEYLALLRERVDASANSGGSEGALAGARTLLAGAAGRVLNAPGAARLAWLSPKERTMADQVRIEILDALAALNEGGGH